MPRARARTVFKPDAKPEAKPEPAPERRESDGSSIVRKLLPARPLLQFDLDFASIATRSPDTVDHLFGEPLRLSTIDDDSMRPLEETTRGAIVKITSTAFEAHAVAVRRKVEEARALCIEAGALKVFVEPVRVQRDRVRKAVEPARVHSLSVREAVDDYRERNPPHGVDDDDFESMLHDLFEGM